MFGAKWMQNLKHCNFTWCDTSNAIYRELMGQIMWLSFGPISTGHSRRHDHRHHRHDWRHRQNCSPVVEMVDALIRSALQTRWVLSRAAGNFGPRLDWLASGFRVARGWRPPSGLPGADRVIFLHSMKRNQNVIKCYNFQIYEAKSIQI